MLDIGLGMRYVPYQVQVEKTGFIPYQTTEDRMVSLERVENLSVDHYIVFIYDLAEGKTMVVSWQTDCDDMVINLYSESSGYYDKPRLGSPWMGVLLRNVSSRTGNFSFTLPHYGGYYVVFYPPNRLESGFNIVYYECRLTWRETVVRYHNYTGTYYEVETRYRVEPYYELYYMVGVIFIVGFSISIAGAALKPFNLTPKTEILH